MTITSSATLHINAYGLSTGSLLVGTDMVVGRSGSQGTLDVLSGPPVVDVSGGMTVAGSLRLGVLSGSGMANQNAGTVAIGNQLILGDSTQPGSEFKGFGQYNLSGGVVRTPSLDIGYTGDSTGEFNLSGSGIVNANNLNGGRSVTGAGNMGFGTVNQSGGQMNLSQTFRLGQWSFGVLPQFRNRGAYNLGGGSFNAQETFIYPANTFYYNGGFLSAGALVVGSNGLGTNAFDGRLPFSAATTAARGPAKGSPAPPLAWIRYTRPHWVINRVAAGGWNTRITAMPISTGRWTSRTLELLPARGKPAATGTTATSTTTGSSTSQTWDCWRPTGRRVSERRSAPIPCLERSQAWVYRA